MSNTELAQYQGAYISPVVDVLSARLRYQAMKEFIDSVLRENVDYGKVPGTDKNTLLKPGAEKLSNFFGLAPRFVIVEKELDWTGENHGGEPFFYFHYKALLFRGDYLAAEGEGSASSFEKKYRWRLSEIVCPECGKPAIKKSKFPPRNNPNAAPGWYCHDKAGGCGANFSAEDKRITEQSRGQVKNPDIADVVNTLQKMAQKRAYVAAVLLAVNGSEYFTQDVEDFIDVEYSIEPPVVTRSGPTVSEPAARTEPTKANGNGHAPKVETTKQAAPAEKPQGEKPLVQNDFWLRANPMIKAQTITAKEANDILVKHGRDYAAAIAELNDISTEAQDEPPEFSLNKQADHD